MTGPEWDEVEALLVLQDCGPLVALLAQLDEPGRKALVRPMRAYSRSGEFGWAPRLSEPGLTLVGAAILPDTRSAAAWLRRFPPSRWDHQFPWGTRPGNSGHLVEVLVHRRPSWIPALVHELAQRLASAQGDGGDFDVVDGLRVALALEPPAVPAYVAQWVEHRWAPWQGRTGLGALRAEPGVARLMPLVFEDDRIAGMLRQAPEFVQAAAEGLIDRDALLDAALARLQRGGRPQATNDYVAVLKELAPTLDEVRVRLADYLALLAAGSASTVAGFAQATLIEAHASGAVADAEMLAATASLLARSEKKILRTQLSWLEQHARKNPESVEGVITAASVALSSPAVDVKQRAAGLLEMLGEAPPERTQSSAPSLPDPPAPRPVVPIDDLDEVVEHLLVYLRSEANGAIGIDLERMLEALPRLAGPEGEALRAIRHRFGDDATYRAYLAPHSYSDGLTVRRAVVAVVASIVGDAWADRTRTFDRRESPPEWALALRILDVAGAVRRDRRVRVVSLPTDDSGALDPEVLTQRLQRAQDEGWEPATLDWEQAVLRASPGAHTAPNLRATVLTLEHDDPNRPDWEPKPPPRKVTRIRITPDPDDNDETDSLWAVLVPRSERPTQGDGRWSPENHFAVWPLLLPHQPQVIAAYFVPELSRAATTRVQGLPGFLHLAESASRGDEAIEVALANLLNGANAEARATAVDAMLALAARGHLNQIRLGRRLAAMVLQGEATAKRLAGTLEDAGLSGAVTAAWGTLHQLLTDLLAGGEQITGMVDLLTCASGLAQKVLDPHAIPGLGELGGRNSRSRQVLEAKRLAALLSPPP